MTDEVDSSLPLPITNLDGLSPKAVNPSSKSSLLIVFSVLWRVVSKVLKTYSYLKKSAKIIGLIGKSAINSNI